MQLSVDYPTLLSIINTKAVPTDGGGTTRIPSMKFDNNNKLLLSSGTARDVSSVQRQQQQQHEQQERKLSVGGVRIFVMDTHFIQQS